ncbi:TetR/AcrR family transcriptional regulator [Paractinoplanes atraurantiacus]|uniref:DNA-binding transcriptional regulator, AcrR family n=1 Tax=Paractinoplanes atraurantiacus TaxID=1036182 RepID=A0A285JZL4_9ACTN|nr:TetR/AcrR family transcriptional regulator [Actinoplanes atraurantiacus]SNY65217.1 DNA-binding transcriptional regulator, AcrR family [Actinoplanes atraurantiacus]
MAQTRDLILDAALRVIQERGLAKATTKEIAKAAGFSEAALYKHFADKSEIFLGVLQERSPGFQPLHSALAVRPGTNTVEANLTAIASAAIAFYHFNFPLFASIFAEPAILHTHRTRLRQLGAGPHKVNEALAAYVKAEQQTGRIPPTTDPEATADLLLGACFQHAFLSHFAPTAPDPSAPARYVTALHLTAAS